MAKLLGSLNVGDKVQFGRLVNYSSLTLVWKVADKNHAGYPANSVTLVTGWISLYKAFDAKEASGGNANRANYGNNRFLYSNLLQWLNKDVASNWFVAQHSYDQSPTVERLGAPGNRGYANAKAFLYGILSGSQDGFSADEKAALLNTTVVVNKPAVDGGGQESVTSKIFLLSYAEVGLANQNNEASEGTKLALFSNNASRIAYTHQYWNDDDRFYNNNTAEKWWCRTPVVSSPTNVRIVSATGAATTESPYTYNIGVRLACNLSANQRIKDTPENGYTGEGAEQLNNSYRLIYNEPPTVPGFITVPNTAIAGTSITVTWGQSTDPDNNPISYNLERELKGERTSWWIPVYSGANLSYNDTVPAGESSIRYQVRAVDTKSAYSGWCTSDEIAIIQNIPPSISGEDIDLGSYNNEAPEPYNYTVNDADNDAVTVTEELDDTILRAYQPPLAEPQQLLLTDAVWRTILNGPHTVKITAQDARSGRAVRTLTFTKDVGCVEFLGPITPFTADNMPTVALVNVVAKMPLGSILQVWICNNGNDEEPAWEDCTGAVLMKRIFNFTNEEKTAETWGVKLYVRLQRGSAVGEVSITSVGGNFK